MANPWEENTQVDSSATSRFKTFGTPDPTLRYDNLYRNSARLVIRNKDSQILLIRVSSDSYYKLPGGGLEPGENFLEAARREALEETGCAIAVGYEDRFALTQEWRDETCGKVQTQISAGYRARLIEDTGTTNLTKEEQKDGFTHEWVGIKEARQKMEGCTPKTAFGRMVKQREAFFLEVYEKDEKMFMDRDREISERKSQIHNNQRLY